MLPHIECRPAAFIYNATVCVQIIPVAECTGKGHIFWEFLPIFAPHWWFGLLIPLLQQRAMFSPATPAADEGPFLSVLFLPHLSKCFLNYRLDFHYFYSEEKSLKYQKPPRCFIKLSPATVLLLQYLLPYILSRCFHKALATHLFWVMGAHHPLPQLPALIFLSSFEG